MVEHVLTVGSASGAGCIGITPLVQQLGQAELHCDTGAHLEIHVDRNGWPLAMLGSSNTASKLAPRDSFKRRRIVQGMIHLAGDHGAKHPDALCAEALDLNRLASGFLRDWMKHGGGPDRRRAQNRNPRAIGLSGASAMIATAVFTAPLPEDEPSLVGSATRTLCADPFMGAFRTSMRRETGTKIRTNLPWALLGGSWPPSARAAILPLPHTGEERKMIGETP
ncbi:MAG: hypothetical protein OXH92_08260 [Bryobacterales bacterium]|nr:hypothetical protein [Bryobacterales bacterium]